MINANITFKPAVGAAFRGAELVMAARKIPGRAS